MEVRLTLLQIYDIEDAGKKAFWDSPPQQFMASGQGFTGKHVWTEDLGCQPVGSHFLGGPFFLFGPSFFLVCCFLVMCWAALLASGFCVLLAFCFACQRFLFFLLCLRLLLLASLHFLFVASLRFSMFAFCCFFIAASCLSFLLLGLLLDYALPLKCYSPKNPKALNPEKI